MRTMKWSLFPSWAIASILQCHCVLSFSARSVSLISRHRGAKMSPAFRPIAPPIYYCRRVQQLSLLVDNSFADSSIPVWVVVVVSLALGFAANAWIQKLLSGKRGLGNFLSDGSGFGQSKFQPLTTKDQDRAVSGDPLPWLRLPELDFVEVAGMNKEDDKTTDFTAIFDDSNHSHGSSGDSSYDVGGSGSGSGDNSDSD